jgi:hypothetical protein
VKLGVPHTGILKSHKFVIVLSESAMITCRYGVAWLRSWKTHNS